MRYGPNLLEEILRRTDIVQLVGRKVKLTRRGNAFWGCCPFHKEKTASFKVENSRRAYKCFSCGAGGDAFKWLMETEGMTFPEAVKQLAGEAGVELPKWSPEDEKKAEQRKTLYDVIAAAADFYQQTLMGPMGIPAQRYLTGRQMDAAEARKFRLGYAPSGNHLLQFLKSKNIPEADIIAAGLARPADERRGVRDFFFDRLMFPITDPRGRVVAFGGRGLSPDAKPKYINTGETSLFSKGHMLYNFATARSVAIREQNIILCEGYMDVIALAAAGFENAVAPLGTALTEDQLQLLWRVASEPTVTFDGDAAGLKAAARAARLALPHIKPGYSLRFAFLPPGEDPDSLVRGTGREAMATVLQNTQPLSDVLWRTETEGRDFSTPERRAGLERTLADIVAQITDAKVADYYKRDFSDRIFQNFKRHKPAKRAVGGGGSYGYGGRGRGDFKPNPFNNPPSEALKNSPLVKNARHGARALKEWEVCRILGAAPGLAARHPETVARLTFTDPQLDSFRGELLNLAASDTGLEGSALNAHLIELGMHDLVARLHIGTNQAQAPQETDDGRAIEEKFLRVAADLQMITEAGPEEVRTNDAEALKARLSEAAARRWQKEHGV